MQQQDSFNLSRKIVISSDINNQVAYEVVSQIMDINNYDEEMSVLNTYQPRPIEIFINSAGGNVTDGFAIIGAMEMSDTPIITYGLGLVASMALGIFAKGDVRVAHRYTRFMYHSISYGAGGYIKDHEEQHEEADYMQRMYNDLFKETKLSKEQMSQIKNEKKNFFFSGKEAIDLGFADEIILKPEKRFKIVSEEELAEIEKESENS